VAVRLSGVVKGNPPLPLSFFFNLHLSYHALTETLSSTSFLGGVGNVDGRKVKLVYGTLSNLYLIFQITFSVFDLISKETIISNAVFTLLCFADNIFRDLVINV
jgi:hypothetical protein